MQNHLLQLSKIFEDILLSHLKKNYLRKGNANSAWNKKDTEYFAKGIIALNYNFTKTRSQKPINYFNDPVMRSGYLAYFLPVNAMKAYNIFYQFLKLDKNKNTFRIADLGAGPLTLTFGFLFHLENHLRKNPKKKITVFIDAFEQNKKILQDGKQILFEFIKNTKAPIEIYLKEHIGPFQKTLRGQKNYDLLLLGNILNEFDERQSQQRLVEKILRQYSGPQTHTLFLEPGSKKFTRDLQALRDQILEETNYYVLAPCLHQNQCPLNLTAKSDWCNFTQRWQAPSFIKSFDAITDLKKEYLLYSYLFLINEPQKELKYKLNEFIAISDVMRGKGRKEIIGCGPSGRVRFIRSNKDESSQNQDFDKISRGQHFQASFYEHNNEYNLNRNVAVKNQNVIKRIC